MVNLERLLESGMETIVSVLLLASIISGETGNICPTEAKIAIAHIYSRNTIFYALDRNFSAIDLAVSMNWQRIKDTSNGAEFIFSEDDMRDERVKKLVRGRELKVKFKRR